MFSLSRLNPRKKREPPGSSLLTVRSLWRAPAWNPDVLLFSPAYHSKSAPVSFRRATQSARPRPRPWTGETSHPWDRKDFLPVSRVERASKPSTPAPTAAMPADEVAYQVRSLTGLLLRSQSEKLPLSFYPSTGRTPSSRQNSSPRPCLRNGLGQTVLAKRQSPVAIATGLCRFFIKPTTHRQADRFPGTLPTRLHTAKHTAQDHCKPAVAFVRRAKKPPCSSHTFPLAMVTDCASGLLCSYAVQGR